uniref:Fibrinogen C-terminal domain-containing protein n=1 Tax=Anopheles atroparvus TaxID=41427 RepID=A0AAG5DNS5_ANOAO
MQQFEEKIMQKLQVQHMAVIEKQADSIKTLVYIINNVLVRQFEIPNQQTNVESDIKHHKSHANQENPFDDEFHKLRNSTTKEVIEKHAALTTNVEQLADYNQNLRNITDDLLVGQRELQKQLISVKDDLQSHRSQVEQEKTHVNEFRKLQNSINAQYEEVIEKLAVHAKNGQQIAESVKNLRNITDNVDRLVTSLSGVENQLTNVENELFEQGNRMYNFSSSCATLNINVTGTYYIRPAGVVAPFSVLCDFENNYNLGGGWTVFQRRIDGAVNFFQNWTMYKDGFGDVNGEHWLGLEKLHLMTRSGRHEMLVMLEDHEGASAYELYDSFQIGSEAEKYKLTVGGYSGTAGDTLKYHHGMKFSTFDQDNDKSGTNCAQSIDGAWWFNSCFYSHLNGKYRKKGEHLNTQYHGVNWANLRTIDFLITDNDLTTPPFTTLVLVFFMQCIERWLVSG